MRASRAVFAGTGPAAITAFRAISPSRPRACCMCAGGMAVWAPGRAIRSEGWRATKRSNPLATNYANWHELGLGKTQFDAEVNLGEQAMEQTTTLPRRRVPKTGFELSVVGAGGWIGQKY